MVMAMARLGPGHEDGHGHGGQKSWPGGGVVGGSPAGGPGVWGLAGGVQGPHGV